MIGRRWRVRVCLENYGRHGVVVITTKPFDRFYQHGLRVATLDLTRDDAEEQIAEARAKARSLAVSLTDLEAVKL
jgi:hypothetical protein